MFWLCLFVFLQFSFFFFLFSVSFFCGFHNPRIFFFFTKNYQKKNREKNDPCSSSPLFTCGTEWKHSETVKEGTRKQRDRPSTMYGTQKNTWSSEPHMRVGKRTPSLSSSSCTHCQVTFSCWMCLSRVTCKRCGYAYCKRCCERTAKLCLWGYPVQQVRVCTSCHRNVRLPPSLFCFCFCFALTFERSLYRYFNLLT